MRESSTYGDGLIFMDRPPGAPKPDMAISLRGEEDEFLK